MSGIDLLTAPWEASASDISGGRLVLRSPSMAFTLAPASSRTEPFFHLSILREVRVLSTTTRAGCRTVEGSAGADAGAEVCAGAGVGGGAGFAWPKRPSGAHIIAEMTAAWEMCMSACFLLLVRGPAEHEKGYRISGRSRPPLLGRAAAACGRQNEFRISARGRKVGGGLHPFAAAHQGFGGAGG